MRAPSYNSHHTIVTSSGQLPAHAHQLQRSRLVSTAGFSKNSSEHQQSSGNTKNNQQRKEQKILAERFKTQMCRNYERKGSCPYENKCMFAHGDADLRTPEMNVRDGLFTEESIEAFRRAQRLLKKRANQQAARLAAAAATMAVEEADARPTERDAFEDSTLLGAAPTNMNSKSAAEVNESTAQNGITTATATPALYYANSSTCRTASAGSMSSATSVSSVGDGTEEAELDGTEDDNVAICTKGGLLLLQGDSSPRFEGSTISNSNSGATPSAAAAAGASRYRHNPYSSTSSISLIRSVVVSPLEPSV